MNSDETSKSGLNLPGTRRPLTPGPLGSPDSCRPFGFRHQRDPHSQIYGPGTIPRLFCTGVPLCRHLDHNTVVPRTLVLRSSLSFGYGDRGTLGILTRDQPCLGRPGSTGVAGREVEGLSVLSVRRYEDDVPFPRWVGRRYPRRSLSRPTVPHKYSSALPTFSPWSEVNTGSVGEGMTRERSFSKVSPDLRLSPDPNSRPTSVLDPSLKSVPDL